MKKILVFIFIGLFGSNPIKAQFISRYGVDFGFSENTLSVNRVGNSYGYISDNANTRFGFTLGGIAEHEIDEHFALQGGLNFVQKGGGPFFANGTTDNTISYFVIPLTIKIRFENPFKRSETISSVKKTISLGPYLGVAFLGGNNINLGRAGYYDTTSGNLRLGIKNLDYGLQLGYGYEYDWGLFWKGTLDISLMDVSYDAGNQIRNFTFAFTLGYLFGSKYN